MLVAVKVSSTTTRKQLTVEDTTPIEQILTDAGISLTGDISINVSGVNYARENLSKPLNSVQGIDLNELVFITAIVNSKNA